MVVIYTIILIVPASLLMYTAYFVLIEMQHGFPDASSWRARFVLWHDLRSQSFSWYRFIIMILTISFTAACLRLSIVLEGGQGSVAILPVGVTGLSMMLLPVSIWSLILFLKIRSLRKNGLIT